MTTSKSWGPFSGSPCIIRYIKYNESASRFEACSLPILLIGSTCLTTVFTDGNIKKFQKPSFADLFFEKQVHSVDYCICRNSVLHSERSLSIATTLLKIRIMKISQFKTLFQLSNMILDLLVNIYGLILSS